MSTDDLKSITRAFYAAIDADQAQSIPPMLATQVVVRLPGAPPLDRTAFQQFGQGFYAAFPDLQHTIEEQVAEGNTVVTRLVARGTHRGEFQGIPPTGRAVTVAAISVQRYRDGQIVEQDLILDALGLMQQLGAIPAPAPAPA
ncbi:MAG: ester cyclase [Dehalococcoidia bacterium]